MIRTIRQRIYGLALLPLALLAMSLLVLNGLAQVEQARNELRNGRRMVVELLHGRAVEALVVGNVLAFDEVTRDLLRGSTTIACISLTDLEQRVVSRHGSCGADILPADTFAVRTTGQGLSDFDSTTESTIGDIAVAMNDAPIRQKREQIGIQLTISLVLIGFVVGVMQRLLRRRLIEPIEQIRRGMDALREGAYQTRIPVRGDDELARLGRSINATIERIAAYTRELERRRDEASRALQEADDEGMARDALVRWLTEDLEGPLHALHGEVTSVAVANNDPSLKARIRRALTLLQDARTSLSELMQVAAMHRMRPAPLSSLTDLWLDLQQDIRQYIESNSASITLTVVGQEVGGDCPPVSDLSVELDSVRLRKALLNLIHAMERHSLDRTLQANAQFVPVAEDQLHVVFTLKASYGLSGDSEADAWLERVGLSAFGRIPPVQLGWTDREARIVDHMLRSLGIVPTYTVAPSGSVSVVVELTCHFTRGSVPPSAAHSRESDHGHIIAGFVTDDPSLDRFTSRGDLGHVEFRMITLDRALNDLTALNANTMLFIDVSTDVADAFTLIHRLRAQTTPPKLIAICPPGRVSSQLGGRLFDAGFLGIVQKPVQYGRVIEVIEATLGMPQHRRSLDSQLGR
jgi:signal transduction histidine kinase